MNYAEKMRRTRNNVQYCYMQYNDIRQKRLEAFIAFLEGYDAPYYLPIIAMVAGTEAGQVICGNKKSVIAVHESLLEKDVLKNSKTGFFIDRDFDDNSTIVRLQDFFLTEGYSIENYYCSTEAFQRIGKSYMHYNCAHPDYDSLVGNYVDLQRRYKQAILDFNGWYCSIKRNEIDVEWSLNEKMLAGYIEMDLEQFIVRKRYTMAQVHHDFPAKPQSAQGDVSKWNAWIDQDLVRRLRGKYEFAFLLEYLKSLDKLVNNPACPFEDHAIKFSMGQKEALSALAQYADRDMNLIDYIRKRAA